jgi:hypothetical protein
LSLSFGGFALLFILLFVVAALPILSTTLPPLFDYPNHLARIHILAALPDAPVLQQYYTIAWGVQPNLAMDLLVPELARLMPLEMAGKVFLLITLCLLAAGPALLHRVLSGSWSPWPLLAFLFLSNNALVWGLVNYLFGLGLCFAVLALWLSLHTAPVTVRLAVGLIAALLLYVAHLEALGVYGVLVMGHAINDARQMQRWRDRLVCVGVAGLPLLAPAAILFLGGSRLLGGTIAVGNPLRKIDLLFSIMDSGNRAVDITCFAFVVLALGVAFKRRWLTLAPSMRLPLALLGLVYVLMPTQILTASQVDHRLPLALALGLVAGLVWTGPSPRVERLLLTAIATVFAVRSGWLEIAWRASDRTYATYLTALDAVLEGSRIAVAYPPAALHLTLTPLAHLPLLAIVRRDAFVPTLFAYPGQQPVAFTAPYAAFVQALSPDMLWAHFAGGTQLLPRDTALALAHCDYLVMLDNAPFVPATNTGIVPVLDTPRFKLYRLAP